MTDRTRFGLVTFKECGRLPYGKRFYLMLKKTVYKIEMGILCKTGRSLVSALYEDSIRIFKKSENLTLILGLNETIVELAITKIVHWCCHVLKIEDGFMGMEMLESWVVM